MYQISKSDLHTPVEYEKVRESENRSVIDLEKKRRISTKTFTFLFEEPRIVINQINEMIYLEQITNPEEIDELIKIYSEILPKKREFSVTMFIEFSDERTMARSMSKMSGIENTVYLTMDDHSLKAIPEEGRSTSTLESTLQYLKFRFTESDSEKFARARNVFIETRHPLYRESAKIPDDLLTALKEEL